MAVVERALPVNNNVLEPADISSPEVSSTGELVGHGITYRGERKKVHQNVHYLLCPDPKE